jgi:hypothetical protein
VTDVFVMGPYIKDENAYLNPGDWLDPDPDDRYGFMLGDICWYYLARNKKRNPGAQRYWSTALAARTPERAKEAARRWLADEDIEATWITLEQARELPDMWLCPGCGRTHAEVPTGHDWDQQHRTCSWVLSAFRTHWWPDGTIRDDYWTPDQEQL